MPRDQGLIPVEMAAKRADMTVIAYGFQSNTYSPPSLDEDMDHTSEDVPWTA